MKIKIGTRKSALAMAQTQIVLNELESEFADIKFEIVPIVTKGDKILDRPLSKVGGKGIFITEIESALQQGEIDIAVHSAKDLPFEIGKNLKISAVISREKSLGFAGDVLVVPHKKVYKKSDIFTIGTGSERRKINLKKIFSNAIFQDIRGNVGTRIEKMLRGEYDAIVLAKAGIFRLGIENNQDFDLHYLDRKTCIPAPNQGIIACECRENTSAEKMLKKINDEKTFREFSAMREISSRLNADCTVPLGTYAQIVDKKMIIQASVNENVFCGESDLSDINSLIEKAVLYLEREQK